MKTSQVIFLRQNLLPIRTFWGRSINNLTYINMKSWPVKTFVLVFGQLSVSVFPSNILYYLKSDKGLNINT